MPKLQLSVQTISEADIL